MKRKLALLILLILSLTVIFSACQQAETTKVEVRWGTEKHVFNISLADFASSTSFNVYNANGQLDSKGDYRKDRAMSGELLSSQDEIVPVAVDGTYTLTITPSAPTDTCVVTGTQVIYAQYLLLSSAQTGETIDLSEWEELDALKADAGETNLPERTDCVILKSETTTTATFRNLSQQPISSSTTVNGFYIGKLHRQATNYTVSTEYDFSGKKPTATVTLDGEERKVELGSSDVIDANQMLIYVRSLSKTPGSLKDGKTVAVFDPLTGATHSASFSYNYEENVILTNQQNIAVTLNTVAITVGGNAFMLQDNIPQTLAGQNVDVHVTDVTLPKLTTVHFRVGYLSYEIAYGNSANTSNWTQILDALQPSEEAE